MYRYQVHLEHICTYHVRIYEHISTVTYHLPVKIYEYMNVYVPLVTYVWRRCLCDPRIASYAFIWCLCFLHLLFTGYTISI